MSPPTIIKARSYWGRKISGLPQTGSLDYSCAKPLKSKQSLFRLQRRNLENCSQCPHQVRNLKIKKQPVTRRHHTSLLLWSAPLKVKQSFMSFPSSSSNLVGSKPWIGTQPSKGLGFLLLIATRLGQASLWLPLRKSATAAGHLSHPIWEVAAFQW